MPDLVVDEQTGSTPRSRLRDLVNRPRPLWLAFFTYAAVAAGLLQFVVLPYVLPGIHDGHGLLIQGDWVYHHEVTAELAGRIREEGWSAWTLRPTREHALYGITSAIYALTVSEPWTLIPLQAALHATSALLLVYIVRVFVSSWRIAVAGALPFLLFPSSLITYAQISKDSYSICGSLMFLYGWLLLVRWPEALRRRSDLSAIAGLVIGGAFLAWTTRPYLVEVMRSVSFGFATLLVIRNTPAIIRKRMPTKRGVVGSGLACLLVAVLVPFEAIGSGLYLVGSNWYRSTPGTMVPPPNAGVAPVPAGVARSEDTRARVPWTPSAALPAAVDNRLYSVAVLRSRWQDNEGRSTLDREVMPGSAVEMTTYSPRLVTIAFLAPFPWQWSEEGSFASTNMMRRSVGLEMILIYVAWVGLALNLWRWRASLELWFLLIYAGGATLTMALTIPNVGSLHRARYGFLMVLVALGASGAISMLSSRRAKQVLQVQH